VRVGMRRGRKRHSSRSNNRKSNIKAQQKSSAKNPPRHPLNPSKSTAQACKPRTSHLLRAFSLRQPTPVPHPPQEQVLHRQHVGQDDLHHLSRRRLLVFRVVRMRLHRRHGCRRDRIRIRGSLRRRGRRLIRRSRWRRRGGRCLGWRESMRRHNSSRR